MMKRLIAGLLVSLVLVGPAIAQATRVLAIADFVDETSGGLFISATRLNEALAALIESRAGGRLRVVPVAQVRDAMRSRGFSPRDLVSPTNASVLAVAVGADVMITGRWTHLDADGPVRDPFWTPGSADAVLEIRMLEAATRNIVLRESFHGIASGSGTIGMLWRAAYMALYQAATTISRI